MRDPHELSSDSGRAGAFAVLTELLVTEYDVNDLFFRLTATCVEVLGAASAGLMLNDLEGSPRLVASSSAVMQTLEELELLHGEGPCLDCFSTSRAVVADLRTTDTRQRWPNFGPAAHRTGFTYVQALPLRVRGDVIGALNVFHTSEEPFDAVSTAMAQSLADLASVGLLQCGLTATASELTVQLQEALNDRIIIAQAKGLLAERGKTDVDRAFHALLRFCDATGKKLTRVARELVTRELSTDQILTES